MSSHLKCAPITWQSRTVGWTATRSVGNMFQKHAPSTSLSLVVVELKVVKELEVVVVVVLGEVKTALATAIMDRGRMRSQGTPISCTKATSTRGELSWRPGSCAGSSWTRSSTSWSTTTRRRTSLCAPPSTSARSGMLPSLPACHQGHPRKQMSGQLKNLLPHLYHYYYSQVFLRRAHKQENLQPVRRDASRVDWLAREDSELPLNIWLPQLSCWASYELVKLGTLLDELLHSSEQC